MITHDDLGPEKLIEVYDAGTGMKGFLVIDNTWFGIAKGGLRITPTVNLDEVFHLARTMTYKNALAQLPFGGGKSGIVADPKAMTKEEKYSLVRAFSEAIRSVTPSLYVAGPDVNTGEKEMAEFVKANGSLKSTTGKPADMCVKPGEECGLPHEFGSTGFGVVEATKVAVESLGKKIEGKSVAIAGFGNVGTFAASLLAKEGAKIVAISDSQGTIFNPKGLKVTEVFDAKKAGGSVVNYKEAEKLKRDDVFSLPVEILIPAALGNVITEKNVKDVKAKVLVEAANLAVRADAEISLFKKGVLVVPDIIANAGGVISSYAEYRGYNPKQMFKLVERKIKKNTVEIIKKAKKDKSTPRKAALEIAMERLNKVKPVAR